MKPLINFSCGRIIPESSVPGPGTGQRVPGPGSGYPVPTTRVLFPVLFCCFPSSSLACFCLLFCNSRRDKAQPAQPETALCSCLALLCLVLSCLPLPFPLSHMRGHVVACFVLFTLRFESLSPGKVKTVNEKRETCSGFPHESETALVCLFASCTYALPWYVPMSDNMSTYV